MPIRKDLGNEYPDHRSLPNGMRRNESKDAGRNDGKIFCKERPGAESERGDVSKRADIEKRAAAQFVDEPKADKGEHQVGHPDADRLQERGFLSQSGHFENAGRKVEDRINAGELVEKGDQEGELDRGFESLRPEATRAGGLMRDGSNLIGFSFDIGLRVTWVDHLEHGNPSGAITLAPDQPAWALRQAETE